MSRQSEYKAKGIFYNEEGNHTRLPTEFYYDKISLKNYRIDHTSCSNKEITQTYIVTTYEYDSYLRDFTEERLYKTSELLTEILNLKESLSNELFDIFGKKSFMHDFIINDNDLNSIINWCKKHGFPFKPYFDESIRIKQIINDGKPRLKGIRFRILEFLFYLNEIYGAYFLYQIITKQDLQPETFAYISVPQAENSLISRDVEFNRVYSGANDNNYLPLSEIKFKKVCSKEDINKCQVLFENKYKELSFTNKISFSNKGMYITVKAGNLFDAAFYQLALLLNDPSKTFGTCPLCYQIFPKNHANQKYCFNTSCYPQKAYKRKKLAEQKNND